jgi:hypothetical protein
MNIHFFRQQIHSLLCFNHFFQINSFSISNYPALHTLKLNNLQKTVDSHREKIYFVHTSHLGIRDVVRPPYRNTIRGL